MLLGFGAMQTPEWQTWSAQSVFVPHKAFTESPEVSSEQAVTNSVKSSTPFVLFISSFPAH